MGIIYLKNLEQQELCRKAGFIAAQTLSILPNFIVPGVTTKFIDSKAEEIVRDLGGFPACKGYVHGNLPPYPGAICINVNDEAVHTVGAERVIKNGDLVKLDLVVDFQGFKSDTAISVLVPPVDPLVLKFAQTGYDALFKGIQQAKDGNRITDISKAIEDFVKPTGYAISHDFVGHGIGRGIHESPSVPSFYSKENDSLLCEGLVLAVEPILFMSQSSEVIMDGWNTRSRAGPISPRLAMKPIATDPLRTAVFTGTFDPITLGHLDVIGRGRLLFEHLVVAIGVNPNKVSLFDIEERVQMARHVVKPFPNVSVEAFEGLTVHFVRRIGARIILRGLRTLSDMEYEFGMTLTNHRLDPAVETVFLMADGEYSHVSSTLIKQVAYYGGAEALKSFVPEELIAPILAKLAIDSAPAARDEEVARPLS